eukprot:TRINITY_DN23267_c0_g1_i1.p1 TRINITY_DN23267_c0_g1~~TRINITY_DN23267_c0_g1_i1.p1  ORF type:complete len:724 (-),score=90.96 TRINITY_DN23267_c0_g1_i1:90-2261(-)
MDESVSRASPSAGTNTKSAWPDRSESFTSFGPQETDIAAMVQSVLRNEFGHLRDWLAERLQHQEMLLKTFGRETPGDGVIGGETAQQRPSKMTADSAQDPANHVAEAHSALINTVSVSEAWVETPKEAPAELHVGRPNRPTFQADAAYWQGQLMDLFDSLDSDGSGSLSVSELQHAFVEVGVPPTEAMNVFTRVSVAKDDEIDRIQWFHLIESALKDNADNETFIKFAGELLDAVAENNIHFQKGHLKSYRCILHVDSTPRALWDMIVIAMLFYILMSLPFTIGFEPIKALKYPDYIIDCMFLIDIVINFRTTFIGPDDRMITSSSKIAWNYVRTWFVWDLLSSVPWDLITAGVVPNLHAARLLKIGKIAKLLRLGKICKTLSESELFERFEDVMPRKAYQSASKMAYLVSTTIVICHWLACVLATIDGGAIDNYLDEIGSDKTQPTRYLAALYWAMATLTTVGYGDMIPLSNGGRAYTMIAMIIGGAFYGYIVGSITSVVTSMDIDRRAFNERMEMFESWLDHHDRLPHILRRRIRRSFKAHWYARTTADDSTIIKDLSRELRADAAFFIIDERVRSNPLFCDLHSSALATLVDVLKHTAADRHEAIVNIGDPGTAMYIIVDGLAKVTDGDPGLGKDFKPKVKNVTAGFANGSEKLPKLTAGDSFGEEIIFDLEECYQYTIKATTQVSMHELPEDEFKKRFRNLPDLRNQMRAKFEAIRHGL